MARSKTKKVFIGIGILCTIAAICFFVAQNIYLEQAHDFENMGISHNCYYYAKAYGIAAYSFLITAISCLVFGFFLSKSKKDV
jgi:hypothetical protein